VSLLDRVRAWKQNEMQQIEQEHLARQGNRRNLDHLKRGDQRDEGAAFVQAAENDHSENVEESDRNRLNEERSDNNTFTWSGPSGVLGCTGQRPEGRLRGGAFQVSIRSDGCHAVPLNLLNLQGEKTSAEGKDYDSGFGRVATCNTRIRLP
jgi:hypothetical protein